MSNKNKGNFISTLLNRIIIKIQKFFDINEYIKCYDSSDQIKIKCFSPNNKKV